MDPPPQRHNPSPALLPPKHNGPIQSQLLREKKKNTERGERSEKKVMACPFIRVDLCRCIDRHISTKPCIFTARPKKKKSHGTPTLNIEKHGLAAKDDKSHKKEVMSQRASQAAGICSTYTVQLGVLVRRLSKSRVCPSCVKGNQSDWRF